MLIICNECDTLSGNPLVMEETLNHKGMFYGDILLHIISQEHHVFLTVVRCMSFGHPKRLTRKWGVIKAFIPLLLTSSLNKKFALLISCFFYLHKTCLCGLMSLPSQVVLCFFVSLFVCLLLFSFFLPFMQLSVNLMQRTTTRLDSKYVKERKKERKKKERTTFYGDVLWR